MAEKKAVTGFDLAELEQNDTAIIDLVHPGTGDEIGATVEVYGQDSQVYRAAARKAEAKYVEYSRRNRGKAMPPEQREALEKTKIVACTKSINNLSYKGQPVTDPADAFDRFPWIYEQTSAGIHERANFIKGSSAK